MIRAELNPRCLLCLNTTDKRRLVILRGPRLTSLCQATFVLSVVCVRSTSLNTEAKARQQSMACAYPYFPRGKKRCQQTSIASHGLPAASSRRV